MLTPMRSREPQNTGCAVWKPHCVRTGGWLSSWTGLHRDLIWGLIWNGCTTHRYGRSHLGDHRVMVRGNHRNLPEQKVCFHTSCKVQNDIKLSTPLPWSKGCKILSESVCHQICCVAGGPQHRIFCAWGRFHCF